MAEFTYRLQTLLEQKEQAHADAEKALVKAESERDEQKHKLQELERRREQLIEKRNQVRRSLLETQRGASTLQAHEAKERSDYVRFLGTEIERAKADIIAQESVVELHERYVAEAKAKVQAAKREVDLLNKHKAKLEERFRRELQAKEELALDEIGNVLFMTRRGSK